MAKQIILDHLTVVLPAHSVEITVPVTSEDDVLTGSVLYPERLVQLVSAVSEKQAEEPGRWIPDITATLKNNAKLYIEIKVTHGVERPKAEALDNLMEIDLGDWEIDALANTEVLERAVLRMAARCWYRCSLYSNLKKFDRNKRNWRPRYLRCSIAGADVKKKSVMLLANIKGSVRPHEPPIRKI